MTNESENINSLRSLKAEDIQALAEGLAKIGAKVAPVIRDISRAIGQFYLSHEAEFKAAAKLMAQVSAHFYIYNEFKENCREHEIVPHEHLYYLIQGDTSFFIQKRNEQDAFIRENWVKLRGALLKEFSSSQSNLIRVELFEEILSAHEAGLYKVCTRSALIEVEGLASDYCKKYESKDDINKRKRLINNWKKRINETDSTAMKSYFIFLAFDNYLRNVYINSNARDFDESISELDMLLSRNYHAHGGASSITERQSLNSILFLHNIASYFAMLSEVSEKKNN